jgi:hypothetical protein
MCPRRWIERVRGILPAARMARPYRQEPLDGAHRARKFDKSTFPSWEKRDSG